MMAENVTASSNQGTVVGIRQQAVSRFSAIPFGQAPVGALRFKAPVPAEWHGTLDATKPGPVAPQLPSRLARALGDFVAEQSEDCLHLTVWTPAADAKRRPVVVWLHGGAWQSGGGAIDWYCGARLAEKGDVVVVAPNYRLGALGWLYVPGQVANLGLLDQEAAIDWVIENIQNFGGDPEQITVMGQSAGAVNVWALLVSPLSAGLMHKAVPLSGGIANASRATAQTYSKALLNALVIADGKATDKATAEAWLATQTNAQVSAYLRGLSANQILTVMLANPQLGNAPAPIEDGTVLPVNSIAALAAGQYRHVPVLAGNTKDEGTLFANLFGTVTGSGIPGFKPNDYDRFALQYNFNPDAPASLTEADLINAAYLPVTATPFGWNALSAFAANSIFLGPVVPQLNSLAGQQPTQVWYYRFDWNEEPVPFNTVYGATHALDLPFLFGNFGPSVFSFAFSTANRPGREALSDAMVRSVAAFAKTGNPNHAGLGVTWPNWPARLVFDASPTQLQIKVE